MFLADLEKQRGELLRLQRLIPLPKPKPKHPTPAPQSVVNVIATPAATGPQEQTPPTIPVPVSLSVTTNSKPGSSASKPVTADTKAKRKIPAKEAQILVAEYLKKHAKQDPFAVTIKAIVKATGVSYGGVQKTPAWRAFNAEREKRRPPSKVRTVPLSTKMLAEIPDSGADNPAEMELAKLIQEQERDKQDDERSKKRPRS